MKTLVRLNFIYFQSETIAGAEPPRRGLSGPAVDSDPLRIPRGKRFGPGRIAETIDPVVQISPFSRILTAPSPSESAASAGESGEIGHGAEIEFRAHTCVRLASVSPKFPLRK